MPYAHILQRVTAAVSYACILFGGYLVVVPYISTMGHSDRAVCLHLTVGDSGRVVCLHPTAGYSGRAVRSHLVWRLCSGHVVHSIVADSGIVCSHPTVGDSGRAVCSHSIAGYSGRAVRLHLI